MKRFLLQGSYLIVCLALMSFESTRLWAQNPELLPKHLASSFQGLKHAWPWLGTRLKFQAQSLSWKDQVLELHQVQIQAQEKIAIACQQLTLEHMDSGVRVRCLYLSLDLSKACRQKALSARLRSLCDFEIHLDAELLEGQGEAWIWKNLQVRGKDRQGRLWTMHVDRVLWHGQWEFQGVQINPCACEDFLKPLWLQVQRIYGNDQVGFLENPQLFWNKQGMPFWMSTVHSDFRATGWLFPEWGWAQRPDLTQAFWVSWPFYWRISSSMDLFLNPGWIWPHGMKNGAKMRWAFKEVQGFISLDQLWMPEDFWVQHLIRSDLRGTIEKDWEWMLTMDWQSRDMEKWVPWPTTDLLAKPYRRSELAVIWKDEHHFLSIQNLWLQSIPSLDRIQAWSEREGRSIDQLSMPAVHALPWIHWSHVLDFSSSWKWQGYVDYLNLWSPQSPLDLGPVPEYSFLGWSEPLDPLASNGEINTYEPFSKVQILDLNFRLQHQSVVFKYFHLSQSIFWSHLNRYFGGLSESRSDMGMNAELSTLWRGYFDQIQHELSLHLRGYGKFWTFETLSSDQIDVWTMDRPVLPSKTLDLYLKSYWKSPEMLLSNQWMISWVGNRDQYLWESGKAQWLGLIFNHIELWDKKVELNSQLSVPLEDIGWPDSSTKLQWSLNRNWKVYIKHHRVNGHSQDSLNFRQVFWGAETELGWVMRNHPVFSLPHTWTHLGGSYAHEPWRVDLSLGLSGPEELDLESAWSVRYLSRCRCWELSIQGIHHSFEPEWAWWIQWKLFPQWD